MTFKKPHPPEVRERAVRMVFENQDESDTQWAAIRSIAVKIGCLGVVLSGAVAPAR
jgi:transposase